MQTQTYHPRLLLCKCTVLNKYIKHKFFLCLPTYLEFASCYVNTMRSLLLVHAECTGRSEVKNQDIGMRPRIMQRFLLFLCPFYIDFFRIFFITGQTLAYIVIICLRIPRKRENRHQISYQNIVRNPYIYARKDYQIMIHFSQKYKFDNQFIEKVAYHFSSNVSFEKHLFCCSIISLLHLFYFILAWHTAFFFLISCPTRCSS